MPEAILLAGPNGAGKSTILEELDIDPGVEKVLADPVAMRYRRGGMAPWVADGNAARQVVRRLKEIEKSRRSFIHETNLADRGLRTRCTRLRALGYETRIIFIGLLYQQVAIQRVAARVREGGHHVAEHDIRRRWARGLDLFFHDYRPIADWWQLFDIGDQFTAVASGSGIDHTRVFDGALWNDYLTMARLLREGYDDPPPVD